MIAAGSRVDVADIPGLDEVDFHTSDTVMRLPELPAPDDDRRRRLRRRRVRPRLLRARHRGHPGPPRPGPAAHQDEDVSAAFTELAGGQWDVRLDTTPSKVARRDDATVLSLSDGSELETDVLLMATGRVPNADRLGLENTVIEVRGRARRRRRVPAHHRRGRLGARRRAAATTSSSTSPTTRPTSCGTTCCTPTTWSPATTASCRARCSPHPQIASVGLTAQAAREQGIEHRAVIHDYADIAYGWAMESPPGEQFVKLLADPRR